MLHNHRKNASTAPRRTAKSYEAHLEVLAYLDAQQDMSNRPKLYNSAQFTPNGTCAASCGHPACAHGCKLVGQNGW